VGLTKHILPTKKGKNWKMRHSLGESGKESMERKKGGNSRERGRP